jgi:hypothetical protein
MRRSVLWGSLGLCLLVSSTVVFFSGTGAADDIHPDFLRTWERTDHPVASGDATRTWMWGPGGYSDAFFEEYADAPGGERLVQYFDKTRMEITDPDVNQYDIWRVTNGLLAYELITGNVQVGDATFKQRQPADTQIAGDAHPDSPTYATFNTVLNADPLPPGTRIERTINQHGMVGTDSALASHEVTAQYYVEQTEHTVASVFWEFMNSSGPVYIEGGIDTDTLFENPFFGVGFPITDAYWVHVPIDGEWTDVLTQCFERRCLTYTPSNPEGWQVEAGNIGQHYYTWRYETTPGDPPESRDDEGIPGVPQIELGPPVPGACEASNQATFVEISDSLGNTNSNSWGQGSGGDWSGGFEVSPTVDTGQELTFTISAVGDCNPLEYRVQRYRPDEGVTIIRDWSESPQFSYTFEPGDSGGYLMLIVDVRNQDPRNYFEDRDDYTYLTYVVK